jgi:allantoicase
VPDQSGGVSADVSSRAIGDWHVILPQTKLQPDHLHAFTAEVEPGRHATHARINIFPDGGVSRFRVFGEPEADGRRQAVRRQLNAMDEPELRGVLADLCGAPAWIDRMAAARPFAKPAAIASAADAALEHVDAAGWQEAFRHHPRIGERAAARAQSESARVQSAREQSGVDGASQADLAALADANREYEAKFGHTFIVCASGRTAPEMQALLRERLKNDPATESRVAAGEQKKITKLRLEKLIG